jgi:hypothetical protein
VIAPTDPSDEGAVPVALTVAERPDLVEPGWLATSDLMPEYNNHGDVMNRYWPRLTEERPEFQFHLAWSPSRVACSGEA